MGRIGFAAIAIWALASAAEAGPKQFDLACDGATSNAGASSPWSVKLSVDLAAHTWCEQGCQTARPIVRIEPTRVWFRDDQARAMPGQPAPFMSVDRMTGQLSARDANGAVIDATCRLAPFTPLPNLF